MPSRQQSPRPAKSRRPQRPPGAQGTQGTHGALEAQWPSEARGAPEAHGTPEAQWPPGTQSALEAGWPAEAQWSRTSRASRASQATGRPKAPWRSRAPRTLPPGAPRPRTRTLLPGVPRAQRTRRPPPGRSACACSPSSRGAGPSSWRRCGGSTSRPAAEAVLDRFTEAGLIDDPAFARAWVESRHHSRGLSRRALSAELHRRGLADEDVHNAIELVDDDREAATARRLIAGKVRATRGQPPMARVRKLMGVLARKGYGAALAYRVVREALEAEGAEISADIAEPDLDIGPEDSPCLPHRSHLEKRSPEAAGHRPPHAGLKSR